MIESEIGLVRSVPGENFVEKGWGYEKWIVNTKDYCGKLLHVDEGKHCSWHYHHQKDETFYVQSGMLHVVLGSDAEEFILTPGDSLHIPPGTLHKFAALEDTDFFEFSTHHDDEDTVRLVEGD